MSLFAELKRRNVFKVAIAYVVVSWLILQVSEIAVPALRLPDWVLSATLYFLVVGFLPAIIFAWAFEMTPEGLKKEKDVDRTESITHVTGRKLDFTIIGLLALAVVYFSVDKFILAPDRQAAAPAVAGERSIAVLPFANMSGDEENEYFADGISEEILNALAKAKGMKVAGRTSSFAFKGRNEDLRLIGETLGVTHILEGSVRKSGDTVRVTAQLIQVEDGFHLWSETWDRELTDIFAIQDEISAAILVQLKSELMGEVQIASAQTDPRAYEKYLKAKQLMYTRKRSAIEEAEILLDEAIALDENFAPAWAQRGIVSNLLSVQQYGELPEVDAQEQARRYQERALELDPDLAEGLAGLGLYYTNQPSQEENVLGIELLERAREINPAMLNAANWLQGAYLGVGRSEDALALLEEIVDSDPLYIPGRFNYVFTSMRLGRAEEMPRVQDRVRGLMAHHPQFLILDSIILNEVGDNSAALLFAQKAYELEPENPQMVAGLGRTLVFINEFEAAMELAWEDAEWRAHTLNILGRPEEASIAARRWFETTNITHPLFDHMAYNGQYEELLQLFEQRWPDIEEYTRQNAPVFGFGHRDLLSVAKSYLETGRDEEFAATMREIRRVQDEQAALGADWTAFSVSEAQYWAMAGDHEQAIAWINRAIDQGNYFMPRISRGWPILKPLEGLPEFEAAQARALENLNRERTEAGLHVLEPEYSL